MIYIFSFRYKPNTELDLLNDFIRIYKLKWKARNVELNNDILVRFVLNGDFDMNYNFKKIKDSGIEIDSIEIDNGKIIQTIRHQELIQIS
jgi:hypothetical protein